MARQYNEADGTKIDRQNLSQLIDLVVPAIKIKNIDAFIEEIQAEVIQDKVIIQGIIHKQLYFVGIDNMIHHQQELMPFSTFVEVPGAERGMEVDVKGVIEHIKATLSPEGTQVHQKVIVELFVKVLEMQQLILLQNPAGPLLKLDQVIGEGTVQTLVEGNFLLPLPAIKITDIDVSILELNANVIPDKVVLQGIIHKQIYYIGTDDLGHHVAEDIPFSTFVDIQGVNTGMHAQLHPRIELVDGVLAEDNQTVLQKVVIEIFVKVTEEIQTNLCLGDGPLLKLPRVISENVLQHMLVNDFVLPQPAIKIVDVDAHIQDLRTKIIDNKVIIQGNLEKQIFYVGEDDIEYHQAEILPFSAFIDVPGAEPDMETQINGFVEHVNYELLNPTLLHQKVVLQFFAKVVEFLQVSVQLATTGPLFKVPAVIGEAVKQILVEVAVPSIIPPIPPVVLAEGVLIKEIRSDGTTEQVLVESVVDLPALAIKIKSVDASVRNVVTDIVDGQILVEGEIVKQIQFVDSKGKVRHLEEIVPFSALMPLDGFDDMDLIPEVIIEDLTYSLIDGCSRLAQVIILKITLAGEESRQIQVFTDIEGPGISVQTVLIRAQEVIGEDLVELEVEEDISLPEVAAFPVAVEAFLADIAGVVGPNNVTVSGIVVKELILARPDDTEFVVHEEIPFEFTSVITDAQAGDNVQIHPEITDILVEIIEGGTVAAQTVIIEVFVKVTRLETFAVIVDVIGPVEITKEIIFVDVVDDGIPRPVPLEVVVDIGPIT